MSWRWVTNCKPEEAAEYVDRANGEYATDTARVGLAVKPGDLRSCADPGSDAPGWFGMVGIYVYREAWIIWFRRVNPSTPPEYAQKNADEPCVVVTHRWIDP